MKKIKITNDQINLKDLKIIQNYLENGQVCLLPTDTCYILAADGLNKDAIRKVFEIKKRPLGKPIHVNVPSLKMAERWVKLTPQAKILARHFLPGPITLVLTKKNIVPDLLTGGRNTLGIRIPDHPLILTLGKILEIPYTTTSANLSDRSTPYSVTEALSQLDKDKIDLVIDVGPLPPRPTSTVVDLTCDPPQILREGAIATEEILRVI